LLEREREGEGERGRETEREKEREGEGEGGRERESLQQLAPRRRVEDDFKEIHYTQHTRKVDT